MQNGHTINSNEIRWATINKAKVLAGTATCNGLPPPHVNVYEQVTQTFSVADAYPNPASGLIYFDVTMKQNATVALEIFNNIGQQIYTSASKLNVGQHTLSVDAGKFSSGLYFYTIKSGDASVASGKITVAE